MLKIKNYVKAESLEQAYELNQKRTACVLGGMVWLKMGNRNIMTAIDLSGLGLDTITETEDAFVIGCMTPLHALETHKKLNAYTNGAIRESVRHIVGVQFRNCATVGGSIFGRFGFSDVLTMFLALDTWVELYNGGTIPLAQFASIEKDNDILVNIIVKKQPLNSVTYTITMEDDETFVVEGPKIEKMLGYTNIESEKGFLFFQRFLKEQGILDDLEEHGIQEGDTVKMYGHAFEYYK